MKLFLLDDSDALGPYLSKSFKKNPAGESCNIYCVNTIYYRNVGRVGDFVNTIFSECVWQDADDVQRGGNHRLTSLTINVSEKHVFLINVNLKPVKNSYRQDQLGIEVLKHIRLMEKLGKVQNTHIVLYSFEEQLKQLQRKPGNLIMLSEGVTFFRLPEGLNNLRDTATLTDLSSQKPVDTHVQIASQKLQALPASLRQTIRARWCRFLVHELDPGKPFATALRNAAKTISSDGIATEAQQTTLVQAWAEIHNHLRLVLTVMSGSEVADLAPLAWKLDDWVQKACRGCLDLVFTANVGVDTLDKIIAYLRESKPSF